MAQQAMSKYRQIGFLMDAGVDVNPDEYLNNPNDIDERLRKGVTYRDKKKRFWVDPKGCTCFEIFPRGLDITNGDRTIYWQWTTDSNGIEMAKSLKARWLEVKGSFWTMDLTPDKEYKVLFRTRMEAVPGQIVYRVSFRRRMEPVSVSSMAGETVNLRLTLPDGSNQEKQGTLPSIGQSLDLEVGSFKVTTHNVGKMEFSMKKSFRGWMGGLVILGVKIETPESQAAASDGNTSGSG